MAAKKVIENIYKKDCKEALKWCAENRSKLKKLNVRTRNFTENSNIKLTISKKKNLAGKFYFIVTREVPINILESL